LKIINNTLKHFFNSAKLIEKIKIANHTFHLKLKLNSDSFANYVHGQHLSILVGLDDTSLFENPTRCYSVWYYDSTKQEVDIAACVKSTGIGAKWINQLVVGDTIYFKTPEGKLLYVPNFETYFFFGDSSALGHLYNIRRQLTKYQKAEGLFYSYEKEELFPDIDATLSFKFVSSNEALYDKIRKLLNSQNFDHQKTIVYIAGETAFCKTISQFCRYDLKLDAKQIKTKPFWHPNKKGLE
jgi:NADPH-dependent ferric siderophore reductase